MAFDVLETTIEQVHAAYKSGELTCRQLVQMYLDRIERYDKKGPAINAIISINPDAFKEADRLDSAFKAGGFVGPLHGIPIIMKDQGDATPMPTTLGSLLFKDYYPDRDAFVVDKLKKAGAIILAKSTLGELGGGDTHGSLFGSTKNPYDLERTAGGSSGGSGASVSANFCTVAVGQEGFASIRRPSTWNGVSGMRPTAGLVSRTGVYAGWPSVNGSLGPMARTVTDLAKLLDVMVGYDPDDPVTARGVGHISESFTASLDSDGLKGARIGILRESMGYDAEPGTEDFNKVTEVFDRAVADLKTAGAEIIDPVVIPNLRALLAKRAGSHADDEEGFRNFLSRSKKPPYRSRSEAMQNPDFQKVVKGSRERWQRNPKPEAHYEYLKAKEELMTHLLKLMADDRLDAIVHKSVEHQPTFIKDGINPPYVDQKGAPHINTFLVYVPSVVVPAGFTRDKLPAGITFLGRPYSDAEMIKFAFAYEHATRHRRPPSSVTPL
jgi:amidase